MAAEYNITAAPALTAAKAAAIGNDASSISTYNFIETASESMTYLEYGTRSLT